MTLSHAVNRNKNFSHPFVHVFRSTRRHTFIEQSRCAEERFFTVGVLGLKERMTPDFIIHYRF